VVAVRLRRLRLEMPGSSSVPARSCVVLWLARRRTLKCPAFDRDGFAAVPDCVGRGRFAAGADRTGARAEVNALSSFLKVTGADSNKRKCPAGLRFKVGPTRRKARSRRACAAETDCCGNPQQLRKFRYSERGKPHSRASVFTPSSGDTADPEQMSYCSTTVPAPQRRWREYWCVLAQRRGPSVERPGSLLRMWRGTCDRGAKPRRGQ
jgi:hypothetical protein